MIAKWACPTCKRPIPAHAAVPWSAHAANDDSGDFVVASAGGVIIAEVFAMHGTLPAGAHARLIAAAPELLTSCKVALGAFERNNCINWDDLAKAIAKSEGGYGDVRRPWRGVR